MTLHICRDFLTLNEDAEDVSMYLTSLFLYGVLNFSIIGQTNFNLSGSSYLVASGTQGDINKGIGLEYAFNPGAGAYTVSSSDVSRILTLRSTSNPKLNSGIFRVQSVNTSSNYLMLDYRSGEAPPVESGTLQWKLFNAETAIPSMLLSPPRNPAGGYRGHGSSSNSRIVFQSPFNTWQVRLTREADADYYQSTGSLAIQFTIAPGFSGTSNGDFNPGILGSHLHIPYWLNAGSQFVFSSLTASHFVGMPGFSPSSADGIFRFYAWGNDIPSGSIFIFTRAVTSTTNQVASFGFVEDEIPTNDPLLRLFSWGMSEPGQTSVGWGVGQVSDSSHVAMSLVAFGLNHRPVWGAPAPYIYVDQVFNASNPFRNLPHYSTTAGDCPFLNATELYPVEAWAGTWVNMDLISDTRVDTANMEPRRMGLIPMGRQGRTNFGAFTTSTDTGKTWIHMSGGIYLPWSGSVLP